MGSPKTNGGSVVHSHAVAQKIGAHARTLFESRTIFCSEAVLTALNHEFGGGLTDEQVIAVSAPFGDAMGDSGCICGALAGAVMGVGVLLGEDHPTRHRKQMRSSARFMHDAFRKEFGAVCCRAVSGNPRRILTVRPDRCAQITVWSAETAARRVMALCPHRISRVSTESEPNAPGGLSGWLLRVIRHLCTRPAC